SRSTRPIRVMMLSAPRRTMLRSAGGRPTCWGKPWAQPRVQVMTAIEERTAAVPLDPEEARRVRAERLERIGKWVLPILIMIFAIWLWDRLCVWNEIPQYILPRPGVVLATLWNDAPLLFGSLLFTLRITFLSLLLAVIGGVGLSVLFAQSKWVEMSFFPFAIVLQVTPIVAIFPLINIYVGNQTAKLLLCAWIVAF